MWMTEGSFDGEDDYIRLPENFDVRIFSHVLSPAEIFSLYRAEKMFFMSPIRRLWFWLQETWMVLVGKREI